MEKARKRVRICLLCVVLTAIIVGILYYYNELQDESIKGEGTLITVIDTGWSRLCQ
ncbi:MAG: hypothetical protein IJZ53_02565 [Tyzzerella sp.]|nr:hypothetical protein [Tyzzerella sp.]